MYRLVIEDDEGRTTVVPLIRDQLSIGRREGNNIRLTERNVSRRHARVLRENNLFYVEDLESYNGIRVNGERIEGKRPLREGDVIQIGDYHLVIRRDAAGTAKRREGETVRERIPIRADAKTEPMGRGLKPPKRSEASPAKPPPAPARPTGLSISSRLVVLTPGITTAEIEIGPRAATIGRGGDIALDHRSLSIEHARIETNGSGVTLRDLGGGLRVNGEACTEATLREGDLIELGQVKLRFARASATGHVTTAPIVPLAEVPEPTEDVAQEPAQEIGEVEIIESSPAPLSAVGAAALGAAEVSPAASEAPAEPAPAAVEPRDTIITTLRDPLATTQPDLPVSLEEAVDVELSPWRRPGVLALCAVLLVALAVGLYFALRNPSEPSSPSKTILAKPNAPVPTAPAPKQENPPKEVATNPPKEVATNPPKEVATNPPKEVATNPPPPAPQPKPLPALSPTTTASELLEQARVAEEAGRLAAAATLYTEAGKLGARRQARAGLARIKRSRRRVRQASARTPRPRRVRRRRPKAVESVQPKAPEPEVRVARAPEPRVDPPPPPPPRPVLPLPPARRIPSPEEKLAEAKSLFKRGTRILLTSPSRAIGIFRKALGLAPHLADLHKNLGIAYGAVQNNGAAARHYRRYLRMRPNASDAGEVRRLLAEVSSPK